MSAGNAASAAMRNQKERKPPIGPSPLDAGNTSASPIRGADDAAHWVVGPHSLSNRVGEDRAKQAHGPTRSPAAAADVRKPMFLGLDPCGGLAIGDGIHEPLSVIRRDRRDLELA